MVKKKTATTKKKAATKKSVAKKATTKKVTAKKKTTTKKADAAKPVASKPAVKKSTAKKPSTAKKAVASKPVKKTVVPTPKPTASKPTPQVEEKAPKTIISKEGYATTGHAWDGIQEFNNPLPRWWVYVFFATVIFAIGYAIYYPSIPSVDGVSGWSQTKEFEKALAERDVARAPFDAKIERMNANDILNEPELLTYSVAAGKALFALNCSQCHGAAGQGAVGYPSFLDDEWLWGGKLDQIIFTITHGVRNLDDPDARASAIMQGFGKDEILSQREIRDVVRYIKVMAEGYSENEASDRGKEIFAGNCATCHGENGGGMHEFGAPALNNQIWLYGGKSKELEETIHGGRAGVMLAFGLKLSETEIKKLALYVHSLTGGEY